MRFPEQYRVTPELLSKRRDLAIPAHLATTAESSPYGGLFLLPRKAGLTGTFFRVVASCAPDSEWEHVSVTLIEKVLKCCPTWAEMCFIKDVFWAADETVVQIHPPQAE